MRSRRASSRREDELDLRAKRLRSDIGPLLPRVPSKVTVDRIERRRQALEAVREFRDDEARLQRMSSWGDPMARALAGLLRFHLKQELPPVVVMRVPTGDVSFAPLSRTSREAQVAVQHYEEPKRLLMGYLDWARKGLHFFADDRVLWCTGRDPRPPAEFLSGRRSDLPYRLAPSAAGSSLLACPHRVAKETLASLRVDWPDAELSVEVCTRCVRPERQLLASLSDGVAVPKPKRTFDISVDLNVDCRGGERCIHRRLPGLSRNLEGQYRFGRLSDRELLQGYREAIRPRLEGTRTPTLVAGGVCYGSDQGRFLEALSPSEAERSALERVLPQVEGLFEVDDATASRALEKLWPQHAEEIVAAIEPDAERAARMVADARSNPGRVSELLHRVARQGAERAALAELPHYTSLPREGQFVDAVAREFRVRGERGAESHLIQSLPREGKERGLAFGLLIALGRDSAHSWQFTPTEQEFGRSLSGLAKELLSVPPEGYDSAFRRLMSTAGVAGL